MCEVGLQQLLVQYGMSNNTFAKFIRPIRDKLLKLSPNKKRLRTFSPKMIEMIHEVLGDPSKFNKN